MAEKMESMEKLNDSIHFNILPYHYKSPTANVNFSIFIDEKTIFQEIKNKRIKLADAEKS